MARQDGIGPGPELLLRGRRCRYVFRKTDACLFWFGRNQGGADGFITYIYIHTHTFLLCFGVSLLIFH